MINQKAMDEIFQKIGEIIPYSGSITVCGGSSIILAHKSRETTEDVDCIECDSYIMNVANQICKDYFHNDNWLNTDVQVTTSYNYTLLSWRTPYKKFGNLMVYLISGVALLCMKLKAFRDNSNDFRDCTTLVKYCKQNGYSYEDIIKTFSDIYQQDATMSVEAEKFLKAEFKTSAFKLDRESILSYVSMLDSGIITTAELPSEFKDEILLEYLDNNQYAVHVQKLLDNNNINKSWKDIKDVLPKEELPDDILLDTIKYL